MAIVTKNPMYLRRCHICGEVCECEGYIPEKCLHCGKSLAPFYYFDEAKALGLIREVDVDLSEEHYKTTALPLTNYPCLRGLTVIW